jgi:hypothetical protein
VARAIRVAVDPATNGRVPDVARRHDLHLDSPAVRRARRDRAAGRCRRGGAAGAAACGVAASRSIARIGAMPARSATKIVSASGNASTTNVPHGPVKRIVSPARRSKGTASPGHRARGSAGSPNADRRETTRASRAGSASSPPDGTRQETNWPGLNGRRSAGSRKRERVSGAWTTTSTRRAVCSTAMAAGFDVHRVARHRDLDDGVGSSTTA